MTLRVSRKLFITTSEVEISVLLTYVSYGLYILECVILIAAVLLQPGKADAGALFSSAVSSAAFGPRGTQTLLAKITIGAAAAFMLIALTLALPALTGPRSVLQSQPESAPSPQPSAQASAVAPPATASPAATSEPAASAATPVTTTASPASSPQAQASPPQQR